MATSKKQRVGILAILIVTVVGTIGSFAVMILANKNQQKQAAVYQTALDNYNAAEKVYQAKLDTQTASLSSQYYATFLPYEIQASKFDINGVSSLTTQDLVVGDGDEVTGSSNLAAYYIGWDANGRIFDQSIDTSANKLKAPLAVTGGLDNASLIQGWKDGMKGMKINGIRLITIPSDKAYGAAGQTDSNGNQTIAPNMPLKFIVMAIPLPEQFPQPDTAALTNAYSAMQ